MHSIKYIQSQYEKGISLREDLYNTQFSIIFSQLSTIQVVKKINIKRKFKSISEALLFIEQFINSNASYNLKFNANAVSILDRNQQNVITGEVDNFNKLIGWFYPVSDSYESSLLLDDQSDLYERAEYEYFYDEARNFGEIFTKKANRLNNFLCSKIYATSKEIMSLKFSYFYPNILFS